MNIRPVLSLFALVAVLFSIVACGSTSTPDLKLIMILNCGDDGGDCNVSGEQCEGRGRWNDLRDHEEIQIADNGGKVFRKHDLEMGGYDDVNKTCIFSETIEMKSSARYRITIGELGPFDITKTTLEDQNWAATLEFND